MNAKNKYVCPHGVSSANACADCFKTSSERTAFVIDPTSEAEQSFGGARRVVPKAPALIVDTADLEIDKPIPFVPASEAEQDIVESSPSIGALEAAAELRKQQINADAVAEFMKDDATAIDKGTCTKEQAITWERLRLCGEVRAMQTLVEASEVRDTPMRIMIEKLRTVCRQVGSSPEAAAIMILREEKMRKNGGERPVFVASDGSKLSGEIASALNAAPQRRDIDQKPPKKAFAMRKNDGKRRLATLVPLGAMEAIAHAASVGLVKYWIDGFRDDGGYSLSQCLDSAVRHIMKRTGGEKYDPDGSKILGHNIDHLDMAIWNLSAACEALRLYGDANDDLWGGPGTATRAMFEERKRLEAEEAGVAKA